MVTKLNDFCGSYYATTKKIEKAKCLYKKIVLACVVTAMGNEWGNTKNMKKESNFGGYNLQISHDAGKKNTATKGRRSKNIKSAK